MMLSKSYTLDRLNLIISLLVTTILGLSLGACSIKKSAEETPVPNIQNVSKDFFVDSTTGKSRIFLCGAASEVEVGGVSESWITHGIQALGHCNISFEVQERALIGRMVNPSFPTEPSRWEVAVTIPISKHYYYEKTKDEYGRESNKYIENSERSHWSARPFIKLELSGMEFQKVSYSLFWSGMKTFSVEDVEWDNEQKFLGFSISGIDSYFKSSNQARFRVNFLELKHNDKFEKTPFSDSNYKYMNVLHVIGHKYDGLRQAMYAAHWDLSKTHKVSLVGFPDQQTEKIAADVIADWNKTLVKIGASTNGLNAFELNTEKPKHFFDLRYPTIYWVSDKRISAHSPLGVGIALADLQNGEIKWGGITLYGGGIESYVKDSMPISIDATKAAEGAKLVSHTMNRLQEQTQRMNSLNASISDGKNIVNKVDNSANVKLTSQDKAELDKIYSASIQLLNKERIQDETRFKNFNLSNLMNIGSSVDKFLDMSLPNGQSGSLAEQAANLSQWQAPNHNYLIKSESGRRYLSQNYLKAIMSSKDLDRNFSMMAPMWKEALSVQKGIQLDEALRRVNKELITHEYGHFLGLGHQFKENILPDADKVPQTIYNELKSKSTEKNQFRNKSSVMGYRYPTVEIASSYDEIAPGPQDELVLRYIYKQEITLFSKGDANFSFSKVDPSGIIPKNIGNKSVSYFPQCNDMEATFNMDPYCNRFDKGNTASEIITEYMNDFNSNLIQSVFQYGDSRSSSGELIEYYLAQRAFEKFGRVRLFYDYMRYNYKDAFKKIFENNDDILAFSKDCAGVDGSDNLKSVVSENAGLTELCLANKKAVKGLLSILTLPLSDYTRENMKNQFVPGGMSGGDVDRDYSKFNGSWSEVGAFPMKLAAMYALTSNNPWTLLEGYPYPVFSYNNPDHRYNYNSVYIDDLVTAIAEGVDKNLRFSILGNSENSNIGKSVLFLGMLMNQFSLSNDTLRVNYDLFEKIVEQSRFDFSIGAVIIKPSDGIQNASKTKVLSGTFYDYRSNQNSVINNVYLLPEGGYYVMDLNSIYYPIGKLIFANQNIQIGLAYRVSYSVAGKDRLAGHSVKRVLREKFEMISRVCIEGKMNDKSEGNGLRSFFNSANSSFDGFFLPTTIAADGTAGWELFNTSVEKAFSTYLKDPKYGTNPPSLRNCYEAIRATGMIVGTAAILNGHFTSMLVEGMEK